VKAYCINLDRRPDRLEHMAMEFQRAGLSFERVAAIDATDPAVAARAKLVPRSSQNLRISTEVYACLQSHRLAWQRMLQEGQTYAAFFEDDLLLVPDIGFLCADEWVPPDAEVVKLETFGVRVHLSRQRLSIGQKWQLARMVSSHVGGAAYVLRADTAAQLLTLSETLGDPVDQLLFNSSYGFADRVVIYQMFPALAVQGDRVGSHKRKFKTGWQATSILDRHAAGQGSAQEVPEGIGARLTRRIREERRALWKDTEYVVVPHGSGES